jgi:hypothetical protein
VEPWCNPDGELVARKSRQLSLLDLLERHDRRVSIRGGGRLMARVYTFATHVETVRSKVQALLENR